MRKLRREINYLREQELSQSPKMTATQAKHKNFKNFNAKYCLPAVIVDHPQCWATLVANLTLKLRGPGGVSDVGIETDRH